MIQPRNDRIVVRRHPPKEGAIKLTDQQKSQCGTVIAAGPGRWHDGEWWFIKGEWMWIDAWRQPMTVQPGMEVLFSSQWNDIAKDHYDDLPLEADSMIHMIQEADILAIIGH